MSRAQQQRAFFAELYERNFDYVYRSLYRLGVAEGDIPDVTQDIFLRVYDKLHTFEHGTSERAWLFAFARGAASNHRKLKRHKGVEYEDERGRGGSKESSAEKDLVQRALGTLSEEQATLLVMFDVEGFSAKEAECVLEESTQTIYRKVRDARRLFRSAVQRIERTQTQPKEVAAWPVTSS